VGIPSFIQERPAKILITGSRIRLSTISFLLAACAGLKNC